jgi:hypothetical protein
LDVRDLIAHYDFVVPGDQLALDELLRSFQVILAG